MNIIKDTHTLPSGMSYGCLWYFFTKLRYDKECTVLQASVAARDKER